MSEDTDISDLPVPEESIHDLPAPQAPIDIRNEPNLGKVLYYGDKQLAGMGAHGIGTLVDVATQTPPGEGSHAERFAAPFEVPRTLQDQEQERYTQNVSKAYDKAFGTGPAATTFKERLPQAAEAIGTVQAIGGAASALTAPKAPVASPIEQGHPLTGVAEAESNRISSALQRGRAAGMDLPDMQVSPTQEAANQIVRQEFSMPGGSPVTAKTLDAVRQNNYAPAYKAVSEVPRIQLGTAYEDDIGNVELGLIKEKIRPPSGGSLTGARAVELSKSLREKAADYFREGTVEATEKGQAHWDAAQAVEDAVERRLKANGKGQMATDWDNARIGYAKTYSVQSALDGAGNVVVPKLKSQLIRGKPLSGGLEDLATMGAVNPKAFQATPQAPRPGFIKRIAGHAAPIAGGAIGGAIGGAVGLPSAGAAGGVALGQNLGERILGR